MDVRINSLTSNIHLTDARAMLAPDVLQEIVEAVLRHLEQVNQQQQERDHDTRIDRRAADLD
jgi:hypothetical protein